MIYKKKKGVKKGFTLSETLVTLAVIGITAAMIIPTLINNTQNQQHFVTFKKLYTDLSNATLLIMSENKGTMKILHPYHVMATVVTAIEMLI